MAKKISRKERKELKLDADARPIQLHPDTKRSVVVVVFLGVTLLLILAAAGQSGPWGNQFYTLLKKFFGWGYYLLPFATFIIALSFLTPERRNLWGMTIIGSAIFVTSGLGLIDIISPGNGGLTGTIVGALKHPFGVPASLVITATALVASFLATVNRPLKIPASIRAMRPGKGGGDAGGKAETNLTVTAPVAAPAAVEPAEAPAAEASQGKKERVAEPRVGELKIVQPRPIQNYTPPPLSLLATSVEKPTIGDLQANANVIKRTLESFGVPVEMGEINVGPSVTRYTLKPAEGVKLARITALNQDLALALAAHPIRIEAPIPGKSLVGIEVPNKAAALVRLGSLLMYPEFQKADPLSFALGRNVQGEPIFPNIDRMPHLLVAGATGSGKSITIHTLLLSLLFKNSPAMLRLILIDPKRVELSVYDAIPHLIAPVVTDSKKAMGALRWVIGEMDRRYELLLAAGVRDIRSFNRSGGEPLPYILIVIDELADLMATYGHEVEGSIIRLAQMSRATGIHLIVSTQRPSVEVITGLIKANITTRIALQVASQIDSRTIIDSAGAEKLLGHGDLLYVSTEKTKPTRIQGAYVTEEEIGKVASFIRKHNQPPEETVALDDTDEPANGKPSFDDFAIPEGDDDELYEQAVELVKTAKKASASLLQRRLKVGYARAARLLDMMEERGVVGPGEGAKPRDILAGG